MKTVIESKVFLSAISLLVLAIILSAVFSIMRPFLITVTWGTIIGFTLTGPVNQLVKKFEGFSANIPWAQGFLQKRAQNLTAAGLFTVFFILSFGIFLFLFKESYKDILGFYQNNVEGINLNQLMYKFSGRIIHFIGQVPDFFLDAENKAKLISLLGNTQELSDHLKKGVIHLLKKISQGGLSAKDLGPMLAGFAVNLYIFTLFTFGIIFSPIDKFVISIFEKKTLNRILGLDFKKLYFDFKQIVELQINVVLENSILQGLVCFVFLYASGTLEFIYCVCLGMLAVVLTLLPAVGVSILTIPTIIIGIVLGLNKLVIFMIIAQIICFVDEWYLRPSYTRPLSGPILNLFYKKEVTEKVDFTKYELPAVLYLISQMGAFPIFGVSGFIFGPILFMMIKVILKDVFKQVA